jgi:hypothetical protein
MFATNDIGPTRQPLLLLSSLILHINVNVFGSKCIHTHIFYHFCRGPFVWSGEFDQLPLPKYGSSVLTSYPWWYPIC